MQQAIAIPRADKRARGAALQPSEANCSLCRQPITMRRALNRRGQKQAFRLRMELASRKTGLCTAGYAALGCGPFSTSSARPLPTPQTCLLETTSRPRQKPLKGLKVILWHCHSFSSQIPALQRLFFFFSRACQLILTRLDHVYNTIFEPDTHSRDTEHDGQTMQL